MKEIELKIYGIKSIQAKDFLKDLRSIKGVDKVGYIERLSVTELKDLAVNILISFDVGIASGLVVYYITKFFEKEKSIDKKPIIINYKNTININQLDSKEDIEKKVKEIIKKA